MCVCVCFQFSPRSGPRTPEFNLHTFSEYSLFNVYGEDAASILTSYITFIALLVSAAFLSGIQLVGEPIECWCPAELSDAMCNYTKSICWISQQYVIDYVSLSCVRRMFSGSPSSTSLIL